MAVFGTKRTQTGQNRTRSLNKDPLGCTAFLQNLEVFFYNLHFYTVDSTTKNGINLQSSFVGPHKKWRWILLMTNIQNITTRIPKIMV
jgi:hypothetical protein